MYLLDTNHAGTLLDERAPLWNRVDVAGSDDFLLGRPSVGELWFMVLNSMRVASNQSKLELLLRRLQTYEFDADAAMEYGRIRTELRRVGRPLPAVDVMIAAIARLHGLTVLTADRHFSSVPGIT